MKRNITRRMFIVLIFAVLVCSAGVLLTAYAVTFSSMITELRERAYSARDYILDTVIVDIDLRNIAQIGEEGDIIRQQAQERLNVFLLGGNFRHLYIAAETETGNIVTTLTFRTPDGMLIPYIPSGELYRDLRRSIHEGEAVTSDRMYLAEHGMTYSIFWPIMTDVDMPTAVVGMEFDANFTYQALRDMVIYSLIFSVILIAFILALAYLLMSKTSEPFYKKMAYLDFLTGIQNRLAYEQRLVHCESLLAKNVSITIVIFDVNNLKTINDTMGHRHGDSYLTNTAKVISELVGNMGDTYRIGGDEFAAIIVGHEQISINKLLGRLRREKRHVLNNTPFDCSFGAATFTPGYDTGLNDVANRADQAMYEEKRRSKR